MSIFYDPSEKDMTLREKLFGIFIALLINAPLILLNAMLICFLVVGKNVS